MLEEFDPKSIEDERLRQVFINLMNLVETQSAKLAEQAKEIQRLRDEVNRLKGEQGKPKIKGNHQPKPDLSSEKQRRESKPHQKSSKQAHIKIDRREIVKVDREQLPSDAVFKGYQEVVMQDIIFRTENILFGHPRNTTPRASSKRTWANCQMGTTVNLGQECKPGCWPYTTKAG
jgi:hypothetical protein